MTDSLLILLVCDDLDFDLFIHVIWPAISIVDFIRYSFGFAWDLRRTHESNIEQLHSDTERIAPAPEIFNFLVKATWIFTCDLEFASCML